MTSTPTHAKTANHPHPLKPTSRNNSIRKRARAEQAADKRRQQLAAHLASGAKLWSPRRRNGLKFIDIFCGAGGSSIGLTNAGYELLLGANHWQTAIDTHQANFRDAEHLCADVSNYDLRYMPRGADVLWASPICTEISPSGGKTRVKRGPDGAPDLVQELGHVSQKGMQRTRATFFDVLRMTEVWRFKAVIVENVPDAVDWELFEIWLAGMERLGYRYKMVSVNTAHVGGSGIQHGPQWRDRLYIVFIRNDIDRMPDLEPRPLARCFGCERDVHGKQTWSPATKGRRFLVGRYRRKPNSSYGQYWYTCPNVGCGIRVEPYVMPASTVIDWSDLGVRIGDLPRTATKPEGLSPNTMRRIRAGLSKYGRRSFYMQNHDGFVEPHRMVKSVDGEPLSTLTTGRSHSLVIPSAFTVNSNHDDDRIGLVAEQPLATCTTKIGDGLVVPPEPFLAVLRRNADAVSLREPMPTLTTAGRHNALIVPYYTNGTVSGTAEPLGTISTHDRYAMVGAGQLAHMADIDAMDALYRMLKPRENLRAQTFPDDYIVLGGTGEQTMQAGNAVSCNVAQWIGEQVAEVLGA